MALLIEYAAWLVAMALLLLASAFFSSSEAALFYLTPQDRRRLRTGNSAQRMAVALLADSDRLLTAVLFGNLIVNVTYFTIASIVSLSLQRLNRHTEAGMFALVSLLVIIVFSEMLPKSLAVLKPRALATLYAVPLTAIVRLADPLLPILRTTNLLSRRLLFPGFKAEPYLRIGDLERAVELSTGDAELLEYEQQVLQNIVLLSETRADELMRPRGQFLTFHAPVSIEDLQGQLPPSGYLLVTEPESDEVATAIALRSLSNIPAARLERHAQDVVYVPWCTTVAEALELMQQRDRQVAAVVNEFGETIGILTFDDILDTIFSHTSSRSERLLKQVPIRQVAPGVWHVTGMTSLRRLLRHFQVDDVPPAKSVTVAGVVQEMLERIPEPGDTCRWGVFHFRVISLPERGQMMIELTLQPAEEESR